ncbi:WD repeat-containing protein WRAP73 isoform X1 [Myotis myotis]|nr:WD repeat-containing protein WRAP73 isoform X1 [Myotis myotis]
MCVTICQPPRSTDLPGMNIDIRALFISLSVTQMALLQSDNSGEGGCSAGGAADHGLVLVHKVRLVHQVPEGLSAGNRLFPGRPLPGLGRETGLQGLRQHLRLQRLAAAAGPGARRCPRLQVGDRQAGHRTLWNAVRAQGGLGSPPPGEEQAGRARTGGSRTRSRQCLPGGQAAPPDLRTLRRMTTGKDAWQPSTCCCLRKVHTGRISNIGCTSPRPPRRNLLLPFPWQHFDTDTQDLAGIEWAPNGCVLAAWDTCLEYKVLLYSLDGRLLATYCAYEWSLGIKSVAWSPSSQFLAVGSYDGKVRILNHVTWKMLTEFGHPAAISDPRVVVYKEAEKSPRGALGRPACPPPRAAESKYEIATVPVSLQTLKPAADRANPKIGVGALAFSPDSYFLATRNDNVPNAVWVWDMQKLRLFVVLEQLGPVRSFQWDPRQPRLAICSGGSKVYLWSPAGCVSVQVPGEGDFQVLSLCWPVTGDSLALLSKDHFCLCFLETEDGADGTLGQLGDHT